MAEFSPRAPPPTKYFRTAAEQRKRVPPDPGFRIRDPGSGDPDPESGLPDPGFRIRNPGSGDPGPESGVPDPGFRIRDPGSGDPDPESGVPDLEFRIRDPGSGDPDPESGLWNSGRVPPPFPVLLWVHRGAEWCPGVPRGAHEASPRARGGPMAGVPTDALKR